MSDEWVQLTPKEMLHRPREAAYYRECRDSNWPHRIRTGIRGSPVSLATPELANIPLFATLIEAGWELCGWTCENYEAEAGPEAHLAGQDGNGWEASMPPGWRKLLEALVAVDPNHDH